MSVLLLCMKTVNNLQVFTKRLPLNSQQVKNTWSQCYFSNSTKVKSEPNKNSTTRTFKEHMTFRKDEANQSIIVQVQSAQSYKELFTYCSSIGTVNNMLHYTTGVDSMHLIIVEFAKESDVKNAFSNCIFLEDQQVVPVQSQFMWFRATGKKLSKLKNMNINLMIENGNKILTDCELEQQLRGCSNISDQMFKLHELTKLNDLGIRIRFLVAKQVEMALCGMFPSASAFPFGSSVNGYGKMGCDLDLVLKLNNDIKVANDESRLVFHSKAIMGSERTTSQRHMEALGDILQLFLPGCSQVRRILQARVPIIKYYQQLADVECDLSMSNLSGVYMSDFLYIMGNIDERVCPLVFAVRRWAAEVNLTNSSPGRWITNFSLTLLVLSFLQNTPKPILPSLSLLVKMAGPEDKCLTDDGLNCTFLRDHRKYLQSNPQTNNDNLHSLLKQFFIYYSGYDFQTKAISLNDLGNIPKPDHSALYIVNPLERGLNVSKNVSNDELDKFKAELRNAAWMLESEEDHAASHWGLLALFRTLKKNAHMHPANANKHKLIEVSSLFENEPEVEVKFKNNIVEKEVRHIKKQSKEQLKKMTNNFSLNVEKSGR